MEILTNYEIPNLKNEKQKIFVTNVYGCIDIEHIKNYLKQLESIKTKNKNIEEIIYLPNTYIYDIKQILWGIFIAYNAIQEKINISEKLGIEILLTLNYTNQIKNIITQSYPKNGKNTGFLIIIKKKKINKKQINQIKTKLKINEINKIKYNKKEALKYYSIENNTDNENLLKIIEKMAGKTI